jgi:hypothetical protein
MRLFKPERRRIEGHRSDSLKANPNAMETRIGNA